MANGNPFKSVKVDIVNEFRNDLYYTQIEIERQFKLAASGGANYKSTIGQIQSLLKANAMTNAAIALLEAMVPEQPEQPVVQSPSPTVEQ
jgi:hypothetical protein